MSDTTGRILVFLGALIATLLIVILIVLVTSDEGSPAAADTTTTTTAATTTTQQPATTTSVAPTTTTAPPTTTTTAPTYLWPEGFGTVTAGTDHEVLVGAGDLVFDNWDATGPIDGYWCGWGSGAGDYSGRITVQLFETGVGVILVSDPTITTSDGLGIGSSEAEILAALGPATREGPGHYVPTEWDMYYQFGAFGYHFHFDTRGTPVQFVKAGFYDNIQLVEGCL